MRKSTNYVTALVKVMKDKAVDYAKYYSGGSELDTSEEHDDSIHDYNEIDATRYKPEDNFKRLYPSSGYYATYTSFFSQPTHIVDNIYLGSAFNAASYYCLTSLGINVIINATKEISQYYPDYFTYYSYDLYDDNKISISRYLEDAYSVLLRHKESGNILVHCYMGASRSASLVIYYLMKKYDMSFDDALDLVKSKRPIVNPTFRFTKDLAKSMANIGECDYDSDNDRNNVKVVEEI